MNLHLTPEMPDVCLSFLLLLTIFIIVVTQKLVLQQSVRKPYRPLLIFNSPWFYPFLNVRSFLRKGYFLMEILHDDDCDQQR